MKKNSKKMCLGLWHNSTTASRGTIHVIKQSIHETPNNKAIIVMLISKRLKT